MNAGADVVVKNVRQARATLDSNDPMGGQALEVKFAHATTSSGTSNTALVAAVAGQKIRVLSIICVGGSAQTVTLKSATTAISPAIPCATSAVQFNDPDFGLCQTATNEALNYAPSATGAISDVSVSYVQFPV